MSLFPALERRADAGVDRSPASDYWYQLINYLSTSSGVSVNETTALNVTAVYSCINLISKHIGSMPLGVFERLDGDRNRVATEHPNYNLLHTRPNGEMTSMSLRSTLQAHLLGWGTYYANIEWTSNYRRIRGLWPLLPNRTALERDKSTGELIYIYTLPSGEPRRLASRDVLRVNGLGMNGLTGYSPIVMGKEAIGLAIATEKHGSLFFSNGAIPGLALTHPGKLSEGAQDNMRKSWEKMHAGLDNKHRLAILEEGVQIEKIGIDPELSQFLETRRYQLEEIARLYNMPLHKISDLSRATFNNIEHLSQEYLTDCLLPYAVQDEQSYDYALFRPDERSRYFTKHNFEGLLRGDSKARAEFYRTMFNIGAFSPNMILAKENINPIGAEGDFHMVQVNMVPLNAYLNGSVAQDIPGAASVDDSNDEDEDDSQNQNQTRNRSGLLEVRLDAVKEGRLRLRERHRGLFREAAAQVVTRETNTIKRYVAKYLRNGDTTGFESHVDDFYTNTFPDYARMKLSPAITAYADAIDWSARSEVGLDPVDDNTELAQFVKDYTQTYVERHTRSSRGQISYILGGGKTEPNDNVFDGVDSVGDQLQIAEEDRPDTLDERMDEWGETRADKIAGEEVTRLDGAVARMVFVGNGFDLRWTAVGESCPYCEVLDGTVVGRDGYFLRQDQELQPPGHEPMHIRFSKRHPPAHQGCDCMITANV